jgi:heat shock protein HtpX
MAWITRPRFPQIRSDTTLVSEQSALRSVADEISRALNTSPVPYVAITGEFNASFTHVGWRRRKVMYIGLPLLCVLNKQERVAILSHEIAHGVNGDPSRGFFVGTALYSLWTWHEVLAPDEIWDRDDLSFGIVSIPLNLSRLLLSRLIGAYAGLLMHLVWRDMQRAEYLADYLAASVAGTEAMTTALEKTSLAEIYHDTIAEISLNGNKRNVFDEMRLRFENLASYEIEQVKRRDVDLLSRLDLTHPPTTFRIEFLNAHSAPEAKVDMSAEAWASMEVELKGLQSKIQEQLVDQHRDSLYY